MLHRLPETAQSLMRAVTGTFAPPDDSTSRQVRVNGAVTFAASILGFFVFLLAFIAVGEWVPRFRPGPGLMMPLALGFYALAMVGGYRVVAGKSPKAAYQGEFSPRRLFIGLFSVLMAAGAVLLIALAADYFGL